jgi:hypothetical protein
VDAFQITLIVATFLCTLVVGFVFAFAVSSCRAYGPWTMADSCERSR